MSVISSHLLAADTKLELDEFGRAKITKKFLVRTNNGVGSNGTNATFPQGIPYNGTNPGPDNEYTVAIQSCSASPDAVPRMLTQYNLDHGASEITGTTDCCAWLLKKTITRVVNDETERVSWHVLCEWGPLPLGFAGGLGTGGPGAVLPQNDPLNDPTIERSEYEHYRRKVDYDINGSAIVNSAGDPINVTVDDLRPVLVFIKNKWPASDIDFLAARYKNALNSDTFRGHAPRTLKIASITKGLLQERSKSDGTGVQFLPMIVKMHKAEMSLGSYGTDETWDIVRADRGAQVILATTTGTGTGAATTYHKAWPKVLTGSSRGEFLDIVNLNPDGSQMTGTGQPNRKTFQVYPALPFSGLGL